MRDEHRLHERVELLLDNRQIFLFFFASAVMLGLVFALGVVVGKRQVSRQAAVGAPLDPLALLDQLGRDEGADDGLTFHETLAASRKPLVPAALDGQEGERQQEQSAEVGAGADIQERDSSRAGGAPGAGGVAAGSTVKMQPVSTAAEPPSGGAEPSAAKTAATTGKPSTPARSEPATPRSVASTTEPERQAQADPHGSYTLQISSFQDRSEANLFVQKLQDAKLAPYVLPTTIAGRGVWYRVRLGRYPSWDEAVAAKESFERKQNIIAYVAKN